MPSRLQVESETLTDATENFTPNRLSADLARLSVIRLRRALLSSIEGAAITAVKIEGVEHEFSSIKGVVEDATDVILNLKQVPFTLHGGQAENSNYQQKRRRRSYQRGYCGGRRC